MNYIIHFLFLVLKACQNLNPGDSQLTDISLAARHPSHQSKMLDTVFNIQTIGCYSFQGSHPVCFSFSSVGAISLINKYYRNAVTETWMTFTFKMFVQMFLHKSFSSIKTSISKFVFVPSTTKVVCSLTTVLFFTLIARELICQIVQNNDLPIRVKTVVILEVSPVKVLAKVSVSVINLHTSQRLLSQL